MVELVDTGSGPMDLEQKMVAIRDRAIRARSIVVDRGRWVECKDAYFGLQYRSAQDIPEWRAKLVSPAMFEIVERLVPEMMDRRPKPSTMPGEPTDEAVARYSERSLDHQWDEQNMQTVLPPVLRDMLITGTGFIYTGIEPGLGLTDKLYTRRVSPWNVYVSPGATSDRDPDCVVIRDLLTEADIWCYYPDIAARIIKNYPQASRRIRDIDAFMQGSDLEPNDALFYVSGTNAQLTAGTGSYESKNSAGSSSSIPDEPLWEFWLMFLRDPRTTMVSVEGPDGPVRVPARHYPYGRVMTLIGDKLVPELDRPNPLPHRMCPLIPVRCYDIGHYFGYSYLARLLDTDAAVNQIDSRILDCIALTLNPERVASDDSNIDFENFSPYPGVLVKKRAGSEYEVIPPAPLPNYCFEERAILKKVLDDAGGFSEISKGNVEGPINRLSGTAVQQLQGPSHTRGHLIIMNMEKALNTWMKQTLANLVVFRPAAWWERTFGPFTVVNPETGEEQPQPYPWENWTEDDLATLPDVRMVVGSSLPADKQQEFNIAVNSYDRGVFGPAGSAMAAEQILKASDNPDKEKILASLKEREKNATPGPDPVEVAKATATVMQGVAALVKAGAMPPWADIDEVMSDLGLPADWDNSGGPVSTAEETMPEIPGLNKATGLGQSPSEQTGVPEAEPELAGEVT